MHLVSVTYLVHLEKVLQRTADGMSLADSKVFLESCGTGPATMIRERELLQDGFKGINLSAT